MAKSDDPRDRYYERSQVMVAVAAAVAMGLFLFALAGGIINHLLNLGG